jgi:hypothetical protein
MSLFNYMGCLTQFYKFNISLYYTKMCFKIQIFCMQVSLSTEQSILGQTLFCVRVQANALWYSAFIQALIHKSLAHTPMNKLAQTKTMQR